MIAWLEKLWDRALEIWLGGGVPMIAIAIIGLVMFGMGMHVWLRLRETAYRSVPETTWRRWINHPDERQGPIGELLDFVTGGKSIKQMAFFFEQLRATELTPFERDLRIMKVCVAAAPLVGLLGTVTGMLTTFGGLASGSGGDKTMGVVASGISEALITTETGLVIALPGLFFRYQLARGYERYKAFLAHLETVCSQKLHRDQGREKRELVMRAAEQEIARTLQRAIS